MTARRRTTSSADYLSDAFALLAGWRRDGVEINRVFRIDDAQHAALTERIKIIADALQVRPRIYRRDGQTLIGRIVAERSSSRRTDRRYIPIHYWRRLTPLHDPEDFFTL